MNLRDDRKPIPPSTFGGKPQILTGSGGTFQSSKATAIVLRA
jgi:hypothetical protein